MGKFIDHTGETCVMNCGLKATIINYHNNKNIDVQFEDGTIIYNKRYTEFKKGTIGHPTIKTKKTDRIGETNIANNGMKITIIAYRGYYDIDIQFEDGTIVYNKKYERFKMGNIRYPATISHTGETRMMNCGLKAKIIDYRNNNDIDIQFEDGVTVYNKTCGNFKKGIIGHPTVKTNKTDRTGETRIMNCGLKATIINYHTTENIDVQFENGTITYNKRYAEFKKGEIGHPNIINTIKLKEFAYKIGNDWYYICSHPNWNEDKILSIKEIYDYKN